VAVSASKLAAVCALAAMVLAPLPAEAQFSGILGSGKRGADKADACGKGKKGDKGGPVLGGLLGGAVDEIARGARLPSFVPVPDFSDQLTESIACRLDPEEQKQAAEATVEATRGEEVGSSSSWTSNTRENVSGTSTITARNDEVASNGAVGRQCITVTDVIIVNGEETTANKRMCRAPGSARYSLAA